MKSILYGCNIDLLTEVERLVGALNTTSVVAELVAYRDQVLQHCLDLREQICQNLSDLVLRTDDLLTEDVLSETQRLALGLRLYNQRLAGPALRGRDSDRLSLRIIHWLHSSHKDTIGIPGAVSTEEFSIWPAPPYPVVYFMPASAQHSLLYQPLFFHEFGHLLYACHRPEMDSLVMELQREIGELLEPLSHHNDILAQAEAQQRELVVRAWYDWIQELLCDAVGLTIGGPAFVLSFNHYLRMSPRTEYHCPANMLGLRRHPVAWLRVRLLALQAKRIGCEPLAKEIEQQWGTIAETLGVVEDYYGFYEDSFLPVIMGVLENMLTELGPYHFSLRDLGTEEWASDSTPVHLLNQGWREYQNNPQQYQSWESRSIAAFLASDMALAGS